MLSTTGFGLPDYAKVETSASAGVLINSNHLVLTDGVVATLYLPETPKTIVLPVVKQPEPVPAKKTPPVARKTVNLTVKPKPTPAPVATSSGMVELYKDPSSRPGSCVSFSKAQTGIDRPIGNGARAGIQGQEPRVGAIGSLKNSIHAVVVVAVKGDQVVFKESGFKKGVITQRSLPRSSFLGFIYQ